MGNRMWICESHPGSASLPVSIWQDDSKQITTHLGFGFYMRKSECMHTKESQSNPQSYGKNIQDLSPISKTLGPAGFQN